jgi:quercetin dioxygenase-like cupin family protein
MSSEAQVTVPVQDKALIEAEEARLLREPQMEIKYFHTFADGIYVREAHVKAGMNGIGHEHTTQHVCMVTKGRLEILAGDEVLEISAPCVFVAEPGVRKVARFLEDTIFINVLSNPTNERDLKKLEDLFIVKSPTFLAYEAQHSLSAGQTS